MRILFTICGRAGSKGIKNKNVQDFLGVPLPLYTLAAIELFMEKHKDIQCDIVVNTDSNKLINILSIRRNYVIHIIQRDKELAGDSIAKIDVIRDCYHRMLQKNDDYDMIIDLDITSPLRKVCDLENLVECMKTAKCDIVESATESRRNPYFNMVKQTQKGVKTVIQSHFTSRQQAPEVYDLNASLYAYNPQFLKTKQSFEDGYQELILMEDTGILDLDHPRDLELMQVIAKYLYNQDKEYSKIYETARAMKREEI